jgi:phosphoglycolate phosphatase
LEDKLAKYRACLFDLDGTLLNTLDDLADAMNITLENMGFPIHPVEAYKYFIGDGIENEARRALPPDKLDDETVKKCVEMCRQQYNHCWSNKTRLYLGISYMLDELVKREIRLVIFSNKPDDFTNLIVNTFLPRWKFDFIRGAKPGVPQKPSPQVPLEIVKQLNVPAEEFVYLGDTNTDMKTANNAGMYAIGALWGFRTADELLANGAKVLIKQPRELLDVIGK